MPSSPHSPRDGSSPRRLIKQVALESPPAGVIDDEEPEELRSTLLRAPHSRDKRTQSGRNIIFLQKGCNSTHVSIINFQVVVSTTKLYWVEANVSIGLVEQPFLLGVHFLKRTPAVQDFGEERSPLKMLLVEVYHVRTAGQVPYVLVMSASLTG